MRKPLFLLLAAMFFAACTTETIDVASQTGYKAAAEEDVYQLPTTRGAIETAVYHEGAGAWIVSQPDPYTLENFQAATVLKL